MRCARCAHEIDNTARACPICGLEQHRPRGEDAPQTGWGRFVDRLVPYGDDRWSWQADDSDQGELSPYGRRPAWAGVAVVVIVGVVMLASFFVIAFLR